MKKARKIILTFKANEEYMYDEINRHSGKSNWIKDILALHISKTKAPQQAGEPTEAAN